MKLLTFQLEGIAYALPLDAVAEVLATPAVRRVPVAPPSVLGLAEAVAGVPIGLQATARSESTALILSHHELAEDIEDEDTLCLQLIRAFSAQLWREIAGAGPWRDVAQEHEDTVSVE